MFRPLSKFCGVFARHQRIQWSSTEGWDIIKQTQDLRAGVLMMLQQFCPRETFHHASFYHHGYGQQHSRLTWCYMSAWPSFRTKGMKKKKKKALCNFRSTESHWISWTSFLLFFLVTIFVSSKMELAQPSHPQLSTSPQVKLGEPTEPASILTSSTLSTMDSVPAVPSVPSPLEHPDFDFDTSSAKASVYDYEKLQAVQIFEVLRRTLKNVHVQSSF